MKTKLKLGKYAIHTIVFFALTSAFATTMGGCSDGDELATNKTDAVDDTAAEADNGVGGDDATEGCTTNKECEQANPKAQQCRVWQCNKELSLCVQKVLPDDVLCDDGKPCTNDTCQAGDCVGKIKVCGGDDQNPCTVNACDESSGDCAITEKADDSICDDGEPCTKPDKCTKGKCVAGPNVCGCNPKDGCTDPDDNACTGTWFCNQVDPKTRRLGSVSSTSRPS